MQESVDALKKMLSQYDWFYDVCAENNRLVVYVHRMSRNIQETVPMAMMGNQVVVHFASSKLARSDQFTTNGSQIPLSNPLPSAFIAVAKAVASNEADVGFGQMFDDLEDAETSGASLTELTKELDRLEKICGSNTLQDIFYEIHDGKNAVTNNSSRYPDVRDSLLNLYRVYGFDVIYEELDG